MSREGRLTCPRFRSQLPAELKPEPGLVHPAHFSIYSVTLISRKREKEIQLQNYRWPLNSLREMGSKKRPFWPRKEPDIQYEDWKAMDLFNTKYAEHLLYARLWFRCWKHTSEWRDKVPAVTWQAFWWYVQQWQAWPPGKGRKAKAKGKQKFKVSPVP